MERLRKRVDRVLAFMLVVITGTAVLNVLWQVFTRWVLRFPSSYTEELARYLLIWMGVLGAAYAVGRKLHLAIDLLPTKLTGRAAHVLDIVIEASVFAFALAVMVVGGLRLVSLTLLLGQTSAALQIPLGYVYLVLPLSGVIMLFYTTTFIVERVRALRGLPVDITESQRTTTDPID